jgi:hypothetical protein
MIYVMPIMGEGQSGGAANIKKRGHHSHALINNDK